MSDGLRHWWSPSGRATLSQDVKILDIAFSANPVPRFGWFLAAREKHRELLKHPPWLMLMRAESRPNAGLDVAWSPARISFSPVAVALSTPRGAGPRRSREIQ
jgi:hypothetical protein